MFKNDEAQEKARIEEARKAAKANAPDEAEKALLFKQKQEQQAREAAAKKEAERIAEIKRIMQLEGF